MKNRHRHKHKATSLFDTRLSPRYVIVTVVCLLLASVVWYLFCIFTSYLPTVTVDDAQRAMLTREAFSATAAEIAAPEREKERALLMPTNTQTFYRRLKLISDAKEKIDLFLFQSYEDEGSEIFYAALLNAADRGVRVRIILDGKIGALKGSLADVEKMLQYHNNIEFYYFNEAYLPSASGMMVLSHDKVMTVDGDKMIVGGSNMGFTAYLGNNDMEVMITNSGNDGAVGQAERYFENALSSGLVKRKYSKKCDFAKREILIAKYSAFFDENRVVGGNDYAAQGVAVDKITYLTNPINDYKKQPIIYHALCELASTSKKSTFVTPYTLLNNDKKAQLRSIAEKNDEFTLVTNSLYNSLNTAYAEYYNTRRDYLGGNIDIYELQTAKQSHAKLYTFDDRYCVIGSFNLDERSIHIDTESVVVIDSPELTGLLNDYIDNEMIAKSLRVGADNRYEPSETVVAGDVPLSKKLRAALLCVLHPIVALL